MKGSGAGGAPTRKEVLERLLVLNTSMISKEQHSIVSHTAQLNKQASTLDAEAYFRDTHKRVARGTRQSANEADERLRHAGVVTKLAQALVRQHDFTEAASQLVGALDELEASSRTATHPVTQVVRTVLGSTFL